MTPSAPLLFQGNCFEQLKLIETGSVDAVITDPPYFISVLGETWDAEPKDKREVSEFHYKWLLEVYRILKPGGYLLAFGAPRTMHRMVVAVEDAGFEIRDQICWIHPQNIPKNQDAAKALDKHFFEIWLVEIGVPLGAEDFRTLVSDYVQGRKDSPLLRKLEQDYGLPPWGVPEEGEGGSVVPAHPLAKENAGRGTALKAVWEPVVIARKPFPGTLATHLLTSNTGPLNIDDVRIPTTDNYSINRFTSGAKPFGGAKGEAYDTVTPSAGRYPSNLLCSPGGQQDDTVLIEGTPALAKPKLRTVEAADTRKAGKGLRFKRKGEFVEDVEQGDGLLGGYTRFFVIPKPSSKEKDEGCGNNTHSTVKPVSLMRHLVKMVTPKGGICLDPFMGSGTTGVACVDEERSFIGIELSPIHFAEAKARIEHRISNHDLSLETVFSLLPEE